MTVLRGYTCKLCYRWVHSQVEFRLYDEHPEWATRKICWRHGQELTKCGVCKVVLPTTDHQQGEFLGLPIIICPHMEIPKVVIKGV